MEHNHFIPRFCVIELLCFFTVFVTYADEFMLYPSDNNWSEKLISLLNKHYSNPASVDSLVVYFYPGIYQVDKTISFSFPNQESDTEFPPVRLQGLGHVVFTGGVQLDNTRLEYLTEKECEKIIDPNAGRNVLCYKFKQNESFSLGELSCIGFGRPKMEMPSILFCNDKRMTLARYPNLLSRENLRERKDVLRVDQIINPGRSKVLVPHDMDKSKATQASFTCKDKRMTSWSKSKDIWLDGVFTRDWAWSFNKVKDIDTANNSITLMYPEKYDMRKDCSFFFVCNLLEELDVPGEFYIDRQKKIIYFYPTDDFDPKSDKLELPIFSSDFFNLIGVCNLEFNNLSFEYGRAGAILLKNCKNVKIKNCDLRNFGSTCISIDGYNNVVSNCSMNSLGSTAIELTGGNRETLLPGNNVVEHCDISDWAFYNRVYTPAVSLSGVGNKIIGNKLYDAPHGAIVVSGNDHLIADNEFFDVLLEFADFGAIYTFSGSSQDMRGHVVRGNYFHDIGKYGDRVNVVYIDECSAGWTIADNLFYRIGNPGARVSAIGLNTGFDIKVDHNVFIDCSQTMELSFHFTTWGNSRYTKFLGPIWDKKYKSVKQISKVYLKAYPELKEFPKSDKIWTRSCSFTNNIVKNIDIPSRHPGRFFVTLSSDLQKSDSLIYSKGNRWLEF